MIHDSTSNNGETTSAAASEVSANQAPFGDQDESGVDLSLLRLMLALTPRQRLLQMERHARDTERLLEYGRKHRQAKAAGNR